MSYVYYVSRLYIYIIYKQTHQWFTEWSVMYTRYSDSQVICAGTGACLYPQSCLEYAAFNDNQIPLSASLLCIDANQIYI